MLDRSRLVSSDEFSSIVNADKKTHKTDFSSWHSSSVLIKPLDDQFIHQSLSAYFLGYKIFAAFPPNSFPTRCYSRNTCFGISRFESKTTAAPHTRIIISTDSYFNSHWLYLCIYVGTSLHSPFKYEQHFVTKQDAYHHFLYSFRHATVVTDDNPWNKSWKSENCPRYMEIEGSNFWLFFGRPKKLVPEAPRHLQCVRGTSILGLT